MDWLDETRGDVRVIAPAEVPSRTIVAFSGRRHAPEGEETPTAFLARRLSDALGLDAMPIHWARQVHGTAAVVVDVAARPGQARNIGECDALVTVLPRAALVVQTADCVPILLAAPGAVGAAHAGWRGSARNVAAATVSALGEIGARPETLKAWLGPSIGPCCYQVGGDVAAQFAGDFLREGCGGGFRLDLRRVNVAQLEAAGVPRLSISVHPACTKCGGARFASYRRDGEKAGRMIALIARLADG